MSISQKTQQYRIVSRACQKGTRLPVERQAGVEKCSTGCESLLLSSNTTKFQETTYLEIK